MKRQDLHIHTTYSDGGATAREYAQRAVSEKLHSIGISDHSFTEYENTCMKSDMLDKYVSEIHSIAQEYGDRLEIFCGIELDRNSMIDTSGLDYVIASVHSLKIGTEYYPVDMSEESQRRLINTHFKSSETEFAKCYFDEVCRHVARTSPDIVGHFDLITKYDSIDEGSPEYREIALEALHEVMKYCKRFEVNTGRVSRGCKSAPYPAEFLLREILRLNGSVVISSDSHKLPQLSYAYDRTCARLKEIGFTSVDRLTRKGFVSDPL